MVLRASTHRVTRHRYQYQWLLQWKNYLSKQSLTVDQSGLLSTCLCPAMLQRDFCVAGHWTLFSVASLNYPERLPDRLQLYLWNSIPDVHLRFPSRAPTRVEHSS